MLEGGVYSKVHECTTAKITSVPLLYASYETVQSISFGNCTSTYYIHKTLYDIKVLVQENVKRQARREEN